MMTRKLFFVLLVLVANISAFAYDFEVNGLRYSILSEDDFTCKVGDMNGLRYTSVCQGAIEIPSIVTNPNTGTRYSVAEIGSSGFADCIYITSVKIPESVVKISGYAFYGCSSLSSIEIPASVQIIDGNPFQHCEGLQSIKVKEGNANYDSRIDCNAIVEKNTNTLITGCKNTFIPNTVKSIGDNAFSSCTTLTSINIPTSVTSIGICAFFHCTGLTSIKFPSTLQSLGAQAFSECSGLTSITLPASLTTMHSQGWGGGDNPFYNSPNITSITVDPNNTEFDSRNSCNAVIRKSDNTLVIGCSSTFIPNTVTAIGKYAFAGNKKLTSITIPKTVSSIGEYAFMGCGLTSITIPEGITSIGLCTFCACENLQTVNFPSTLESIGQNSFQQTAIRELYIPANVSNINSYAFSWDANNLVSIVVDENNATYDSRDNCNAIIHKSDNKLILACQNTIIPNSVTELGSMAFYPCKSLKSIVLPKSVTKIGSYCFALCTELTSVTVGNKTPVSIDNNIFSNSANATLYVPYGCSAAYWAADGWNNFKEIVEFDDSPSIAFADGAVKALCVANWDTNNDGDLSEAEAAVVTSLGEVFKKNEEITSFNELQYFIGLTAISESAFYMCKNLKAVTLPNTITSIEADAFAFCSGLSSFTIPQSVTAIGDRALEYCTGLTSIVIPKSVTSIGELVPFGGNLALTSIVVEDGNPVYDSRDNCNGIIKTETNELIAGFKTTVIPATVLTIGKGAFAYDAAPTTYYIPDNVTTIAEMAFYMSKNLESLTLPKNLTTIGDQAFYQCENLQSLVLPNSLTSIGQWAFYHCHSLTSLVIPSGVTSIGVNAFRVCKGLTSIVIPQSVTAIGSGAFQGCTGLTSVTVRRTVPVEITNDTFFKPENLTLYVPEDGKAAYKAADCWKDFGKIIGYGYGTAFGSPEKSIVAGTRAEFEDYTVTYGEAGSPDFQIASDPITVPLFGGEQQVTWDNYFAGNGVNGNKPGGTFYLIHPTFNCTMNVYVRQNAGKELYVEESGRVMEAFNGITHDEIYVGKYAIPMKANLTYKIYCRGSKLGLYGMQAYWTDEDELDAVNIAFADANVKALCVANWDTNNDGELSMAEAAAVTSLGEVFHGKGITSFDELRYFTGLTEMQDWSTFADCTELKSITIPVNVRKIYGSSFVNCAALEQISVDPSNAFYDSREGCNAIIVKANNRLIVGCQNTTIPESVTAIGHAAFWGRWSMTYITIPETVKIIEGGAFTWSSIENLKIPAKVEAIGGEAFAYTSIKNVTLPETLTTLEDGAFRNCEQLESVVIGSGLEVIPDSCFKYCRNLASVDLGQVKTIGGGAFAQTGMTSVVLPASVKAVNHEAFAGSPIATLDLGKVEKVGDAAFISTAIEELTIPATVTEGGLETFSWNWSMKKVTFEEGCEEVFPCMFHGNENLSEVIFASTIKKIDVVAFQSCKSLTSITLPRSVTSIGESAFNGCDALTTVVVENPVPVELENAETFSNRQNATLIVPSGSGDAYRNANVWKEFGTITENFSNTDISILANAIYVEPQTGSVGRPMTMDIKLKNEKAIKTYNFALKLPKGVTMAKDGNGEYSYEISGRHATYSPTLNYDANSGTYNFAVFSKVLGNDGPIMTLKLLVSEDMALGEYPVTVSEGKYTLDGGYESVTLPATTAVLTIVEKTYIPGDVNDDDDVDIADMVCIVNRVVKIDTPKFIEAAADVSGNGEVGMEDALKILDYIVGDIETLAPSRRLASFAARAMGRSFSEMTDAGMGDVTSLVDVANVSDAFYADDLSVKPGSEAQFTLKLKNAQTTNGYSFDLVLPDGVTMAKDDGGDYRCTLSSRHDKTHQLKIKYKEDTRTYSVAVYSLSSKAINGNDGDVLTFTLAVGNDLAEDAALSIQNAKYSLTSGASKVSLPREEVKIVSGADVLKGDANNDGKVDIVDVTSTISHILGQTPDGFNAAAADMNNDGVVNIVDVTSIIDVILKAK